jgi:vesicle transport through interaction with t-SNAREs protein 1
MNTPLCRSRFGSSIPLAHCGRTMLEEQLAECRERAEEAKQEILKLKDTPDNRKGEICDRAMKLLKQSDKGLTDLQMEAKSAPPAERKMLLEKEEALREELKAVAQELEEARRKSLLGGSGADQLFLSQKERLRATGVTETLQKQKNKLTESMRTAAETEHVGLDILHNLHEQRETIQRSKDRVGELAANNREAARSVKELEKPCVLM